MYRNVLPRARHVWRHAHPDLPSTIAAGAVGVSRGPVVAGSLVGRGLTRATLAGG